MFFFENMYLELLWVSDAEDAQRAPAWRTRLWDRWSRRQAGACPFGLVFRGATGSPGPPFSTWSYHPAYSEVAIDIGLGTPLSEPELFAFDGAAPGRTSDLRPELPLVLAW
jgi:hypothetical protein